jgi:hypothetical protein
MVDDVDFWLRGGSLNAGFFFGIFFFILILLYILYHII